MIKIFIPQSNKKNKQSNRGFWQNETGKIYYDYIKEHNYTMSNKGFYYSSLFFNYLDKLKKSLQQECIFYIEDKKGYIYYDRSRINKLSKRLVLIIEKKDLKYNIKKYLKLYKGLTVYKQKRGYKIEAYFNEN